MEEEYCLTAKELSENINNGAYNIIKSAHESGIISKDQALKMLKLQVIAHTKIENPFSTTVLDEIAKDLGNNLRFTVVELLDDIKEF